MSQCEIIPLSAPLTLRKGMADSYKLEEFHEFDPLNPEWRLRNNRKNLEQTRKLFEAVEQASCKVIYADINFRGNILNQLCMPKMKQLQILDVGNNDIESVQSLKRAVMPSLTKIWLNDNFITNIQSLEKCHFPSLKVVWLTSNKIVQLNFQHVYWPEMSEFYIQKNLLTTTKNILKSDQAHLKWAAIQSNHWEQNSGQLFVQPQKEEGRIRRRFRSIQRVWMPIYFGQMHNRPINRAPNGNNT